MSNNSANPLGRLSSPHPTHSMSISTSSPLAASSLPRDIPLLRYADDAMMDTHKPSPSSSSIISGSWRRGSSVCMSSDDEDEEEPSVKRGRQDRKESVNESDGGGDGLMWDMDVTSSSHQLHRPQSNSSLLTPKMPSTPTPTTFPAGSFSTPLASATPFSLFAPQPSFLKHSPRIRSSRRSHSKSRPSPIQTLPHVKSLLAEQERLSSRPATPVGLYTPLRKMSADEDMTSGGSGGSDGMMLDGKGSGSRRNSLLPQTKSINRIVRSLQDEVKPFEKEVAHEHVTTSLLKRAINPLAESALSGDSPDTPATPLGIHRASVSGPSSATSAVGFHPLQHQIVGDDKEFELDLIARPPPIPFNQIKDPANYISNTSKLNPENGIFARNHEHITHSPSLSPVLRPGSMSPSLDRKGKRKMSFDDRFEPYKRHRIPSSPIHPSSAERANSVGAQGSFSMPDRTLSPTTAVLGGQFPPLGSPALVPGGGGNGPFGLGIPMMGQVGSGVGGYFGITRSRSLSASSCASNASSMVGVVLHSSSGNSNTGLNQQQQPLQQQSLQQQQQQQQQPNIIQPVPQSTQGGSTATFLHPHHPHHHVGNVVIQRPGSPRLGLLVAAAAGAAGTPIPGSPVRQLGQMLNITGAQG
ncbi:hypothetical protein HDU97_002540, partial [Phlyctochytrium planicorne]